MDQLSIPPQPHRGLDPAITPALYREARDLNVLFDYQRGVAIDVIQQRNQMGRGDVYRRLRRMGDSPSRGNWLRRLREQRAVAELGACA